MESRSAGVQWWFIYEEPSPPPPPWSGYHGTTGMDSMPTHTIHALPETPRPCLEDICPKPLAIPSLRKSQADCQTYGLWLPLRSTMGALASSGPDSVPALPRPQSRYLLHRRENDAVAHTTPFRESASRESGTPCQLSLSTCLTISCFCVSSSGSCC